MAENESLTGHVFFLVVQAPKQKLVTSSGKQLGTLQLY